MSVGDIKKDKFMNDKKEKIRQFLTKHINHNDFKDNDHLFEKGFVNSLMAMELVLFVENEFSIQIGSEDLKLDNFKSVNDISRLVILKTNE